MMRALLQYFQYDWFFVFLTIVLTFLYLNTNQVLFIILLIILFCRQLFLSKGVFYLSLCFCLVFGIRFKTLNANFTADTSLPLGQASTYQVVINGRYLNYTENRLSGPADLWLSDNRQLKVQIQLNDLPQEQANVLLTGVYVVEFEGDLAEPLPPRNFGVFDYPQYLKQMGIRFLLKGHSVKDYQFKNDWRYWADNFISRLRLFYINQPTNSLTALMNKFVWNIQSTNYRTDSVLYQQLGILHLLSISGFQAYALSRYLRWLFARLGIYVDIIDGLIFICLLAYGYVLNWPVGFVRAVGVRGLYLLGRYFKLPINRVDSLSWVGLITLFINPFLIDNLGFQLSYLLTFVIGWLAPNHRQIAPKRVELILFNVICQLISWPILVAHYHEISPGQVLIYLIMGSLVSGYIMPILWLLAGVTGLLGSRFWHTLGYFVADIFESILKFLDWITQWLPQWVVGQVEPVWILILISVSLWLVLGFIYRNKKQLIIATCLYLSIWLMLPYRHFSHRLTVIDVGQGDAILFQPAHSRKSYLIDTGGRLRFTADGPVVDESFAKNTLVPALKALGVQKITGLITTHPDLDHVGNLTGLAEAIPIQNLYTSQSSLTDSFFVGQLNQVKEVTRIHQLEPGASAVLNPCIHLYIPDLNHLDHNDQSIITYLTIGNTTAILMGDATVATETHLIDRFPHLQADIIKIGHHGSNTSTSETFLQVLKPQLAVNSAGYNNRFNHPHQEVVDRLQKLNIPIFSTHQVGAIQLRLGKEGAVSIEIALQ